MTHSKTKTSSVNSLNALRTLKIRVKGADDVEISKAGQFWKARFKGCSNFCFASTPEEARSRLLNTPSERVKDSHRNAAMRKKNVADGYKAA